MEGCVLSRSARSGLRLVLLLALPGSACSLAGVAAPSRFDAAKIGRRLAKPTGALAVVPAIEPPRVTSGPGSSEPGSSDDLELFSRGCREAGAAALCLSLGEGVSDASFAGAIARVSREQFESTAFPGPCPLLVRAWPLSTEQLQLFKASGMDALVIPAEFELSASSLEECYK
mmetsp:Transcript_43448/g.100558  ORF Transcript_43448/g.100558 Transcript_43448/m.100558 type:complete len:173 (+) Transcript_43448:3-521(+)